MNDKLVVHYEKALFFFMDQESNMATTAKQSLQIKGHHKKVFSVWFLKFKIWNEEVFSCLLFNQEGIFEMKKYFRVCSGIKEWSFEMKKYFHVC